MTKVHNITSLKNPLSSNAKFAISLGAQVALGLLGIAVTAAVTIFIAKTIDVVTPDVAE